MTISTAFAATQNSKNRIVINPARTIGTVNPNVFGSFLENLHRCIYGGVYDPESPVADERGFRKDVMEGAKTMGVANVRFPGGCWAPYYHFYDGIGPKESRPKTLWRSYYGEPQNDFGTDEFVEWCREIGAEPYICVNMGTGTVEEARNWVEYCNAPVGSQWADKRAANGHPEPFNVKYWSLGNEIEGKWELGYCDNGHDYVKKAREFAMAMKAADPNIILVANGAHFPIIDGYYSAPGGRYPEPADNWNRTVLDEMFGYIDYISMHDYIGNDYKDRIRDKLADMTQEEIHYYLAEGMGFLEDAYQIVRQDIKLVQHKHSNLKPIGIALDEYNPWYQEDNVTFSPYNLSDALLVGQYFNIFLRNADVATLCNMAQLVNTLPALVVEPGTDRYYRQPISFIPEMFLPNRGATAVDTWTESTRRKGWYYPDMPLIDASATLDESGRALTVNIVNNDAANEQSVTIEALGLELSDYTARTLTGDLADRNDFDHPNAIEPTTVNGTLQQDGTVTLAPASVTVLRFALRG